MITTTTEGKTFVIDGQGFFTEHEERHLDCWLRAMSEKDAARDLCKSPETIHWHRKMLREKTHQNNAQGVLVYCLARGYIRMLVLVLIMLSVMPMARTRVTRPAHTRPPTGRQIGRREISALYA